MDKKIKIVTVGDESIGKVEFLWAYYKNEIPPDYVPTVADTIDCTIKYKEKDISLQILDTSGKDDLEQIRALYYANTKELIILIKN